MKDAHSLDSVTLRFFENVTAGRGKGFHVRRYIQAIQDILGVPLNQLSVLDLACGEGVYAIESALQGAQVLGIDARAERMSRGVEIAQRLGLDRVRFEQNDVRQITVASHGQYDVVFAIGITYHLDQPAIFSFLENIYGLTRKVVLIDTQTALAPDVRVSYKSREYTGTTIREHEEEDTEETRRNRLLGSLDNTLSFVLSKDGLIRFLNDLEFTSVFECHVPLDPNRDADRVTLLALKGKPTKIFSYPWVNEKIDPEMQEVILKSRPSFRTTFNQKATPKPGLLSHIFRKIRFGIWWISSHM